MKTNICSALVVFFLSLTGVSAQYNQSNPQFPPNANPIDNISTELTAIAKSVKTLNENMKVFLDKLGGGNTNDKQQKILAGLQILNEAEQRLGTLQKLQIDLTEKQIPARARLTQVDQELRPESIDRSATFLGTTKTEEFRENRRKSLETEKRELQMLLAQLDNTIAQTRSEVSEAQALVGRLRRKFLPIIEQQLSDL
jgi:septal ring factor EnvC (AmiA/AmiB activator)